MNEEQEIRSTLSELGKAFFKMTMVFIVLGISIVFSGYVTMYLWNGIMTTTFQLIELTWAQAIGVNLLINFIVSQRKTKSEDTILKIFFYAIATNLLYMLIGWIVMMFI